MTRVAECAAGRGDRVGGKPGEAIRPLPWLQYGQGHIRLVNNDKRVFVVRMTRPKAGKEQVPSIQLTRPSAALIAPAALGIRRAPVAIKTELGPTLRTAFDVDSFAINALYIARQASSTDV